MNTDRLEPANESNEKEDLRLLILETLDLPLEPTLINSILRISGTNGSRAVDLADIISSRRSLEESILKIANSECFGLSQRISAIDRAIKVLGYEAVKSLALGVLVMESVSERAAPGLFDRRRFWTHSLACAYLSKRIAAMTHRAEMETMFVCGLLHDIGKVFLTMYFPDSYNHVITLVETGPLTSIQGEDQVLGFTHAEVGMWLAQRWNLPKSIIFTIANHHYVGKHDKHHNSITSILRLANHICLQELISLEKCAIVEPLEQMVLEDLKLGESDLRDLRAALTEEKANLQALS